jgi:hypothetical protein
MCSSGVAYSSIPAISTPSTRYRLLDVHCIGRSRGRQRLRDCLEAGDGEPRSVAKLHRIDELVHVVFPISILQNTSRDAYWTSRMSYKLPASDARDVSGFPAFVLTLTLQVRRQSTTLIGCALSDAKKWAMDTTRNFCWRVVGIRSHLLESFTRDQPFNSVRPKSTFGSSSHRSA